MDIPQCNAAGRALIKRFESCMLKSYQDIRGIWTCGWGETGPDIVSGLVWTQAYADERFDARIDIVAQLVDEAVRYELNENEFSALVSFVYNIGIGEFMKSTLLRDINDGELDDVPNEFPRWCMAGGKKVAGLERRRAAEVALWEKPIEENDG